MRRPRAHELLADDPSWAGRVIPTFRPDRYLEAGQPGWAACDRRARRGVGHRHGRLRRVHRRTGAAAAALHRARRNRGRPRPRRRAHRSARPRRREAHLPGSARGHGHGGRDGRLPAHMVLEMARMSCDDGLVMTLHPGVVRSHHGPTADRFGADTGHDIPVALELTNALAAAPRPLRHDARIPPRRLHRRRDAVVTRARPARGLLSVGVRRRAVVVPRRARRDQAVPGRDRRDRRLLAHCRLRRRHACLLHDPGPARHVEAHRRRRASPSSSPSTACPSMRPSRPLSTS